jgi:SAM-dependent methyltransferase
MENIPNISDTSELNLIFLTPDAFTRLDESDDSLFYAKDRFVSHLDSFALQTVERLIGELVVEEKPAILDLMAGWDSHLPRDLNPSKVVGLGLNVRELAENKALDEIVVKDLNKDPGLPFEDDTFDVVLNTVSVDYLVHPVEIFKEVGRILKPGGLFIVIFSNRMFPQKAVKVWRESSEDERILLVEDFFKASGRFESPTLFVSKGKPRPKDDKYAHRGIPSDPIYAFYADKKGGSSSNRMKSPVKLDFFKGPEKEELEKRKRAVKETLCCPYCGEKLRKWAVPENPFACTWDNEFMYICFNNECSYYVRGWDFMIKEGNSGSYRLMYDPERNTFYPVPVQTGASLRESIVD